MSNLSAYLRVAAERPLLDARAERRLGTLVRLGHEASARRAGGAGTRADAAAMVAGREAWTILVESNLRLVVSIARRFPGHTLVDLSDLIQAGNHGLLLAADGFDPDRGCRFSTYASGLIRAQISRAIDKGTSALHLPIDSVNALRGALRIAGDVGAELPDNFGVLKRAYVAVSLDAVLEDGSVSLGDLQPSNAISVELEVEKRLESQLVHRLLSRLPRMHRQALHLHFGFADGRQLSNTAVAATLGVSRRRSRRLVTEGLQMLQDLATSHQLAVGLDGHEVS